VRTKYDMINVFIIKNYLVLSDTYNLDNKHWFILCELDICLWGDCLKDVFRIRKSKDRQHNDQKKKDKETNNDLQDTTQKIKDGVIRTPLNSGLNSGAPDG
jgi:hypothetical protein